MKFMHNFIAFGLIWINLLVSGLNISFSKMIDTEKNNYNSNNNHYNYTKEYLMESSKRLRNLEEQDIKKILIKFECASLCFVILLVVSFTFEGKDENTKCCFCIDEKRLNKCFEGNNSINTSGIDCVGAIFFCLFMIMIYIVIVIFSMISWIILACGKHYLRIFSTVLLIILRFGIIIMSLILSRELNSLIVGGISSFSIIFNLLAIFLPNFCGILSYKDKTEKEEQKETQISDPLVNPQISNDEKQNNNEINNNDDKEQNKETIIGPIIINESESESGYSDSGNIYNIKN